MLGKLCFFPGQSSFTSCEGSLSFLNLWLTWHLLAKGILLKLDPSRHALVVLLVLDATLVSKLARAWSKNRSRDSLFSAKTWRSKVASHECLRSKPDGEVAPIDLGNRPCQHSRRWLVFCDLVKKAPHHTSYTEYSVTHTWQTMKELSSHPLGGPRDHDPNQFAHPRCSRFVFWKLCFSDCKFDISWPMAFSSWREPPCTVVSLSWTKSCCLILLGLEASHFRSCNGKVKVPKRLSSTLCMSFGQFWPNFLRQRHLGRLAVWWPIWFILCQWLWSEKIFAFYNTTWCCFDIWWEFEFSLLTSRFLESYHCSL